MKSLEIAELAAGITSFVGRPQLLLGRRTECAALDELVSAAIAGQGRSLVIRGETGSGKTALLEYAAGRATGCRVLRAAGVESEQAFPFAGLHRLCAPLLDRLDALPPPQRSALATTFGLERAEEPDRFLVGLGVHTLLSHVAAERPLLCLVDDAHWLDTPSCEILAFAARRISAGSLALVAAVTDGCDDRALNGLSELVLAGLGEADARVLFDAEVAGPVDERVRDRFVEETRGNPNAIVDGLRGATPADLAGGFGVACTAPPTRSSDEPIRRRLEALPGAARRLVVVAAAEPTGDAALIWRAAGELGLGAEAAESAVAAGILELGGRVVFRDPHARAAAYRTASREERREAHRALGLARSPELDADWRAWHLAHAAVGLDEGIAHDLVGASDQARVRGGMAAAAAFLERAAELTPSPAQRRQRTLAAAGCKLRAGSPEAARRLLALAESGSLGALDELHADVIRAELELSAGDGGAATSGLLAAAARLETCDPVAAREAYLAAFEAALATGGAAHVARAVAAAKLDRAPRTAGGRDLLLAGLATLFIDGPAAAVPALERALKTARDELESGGDVVRRLHLAARVARFLGDDEAWDELTTRALDAARAEGSFGLLPAALNERMAVEHLVGNTAGVQALAAEFEAVVERTGSVARSHADPLLAARSGSGLELSTLIEARRDDTAWLAVAEPARAELLNGIGGWSEALDSAEWMTRQPAQLWSSLWTTLEHVEAAVRVGEPDRAEAAVARLAGLAAAGRSDWAHGTELLCRALLANDDAAEALYCAAIDRLARTRARVVLARAELLYGEWLRRRGRRVDARVYLRVALELLLAAGADGFAERARRELLATGETARKRVDETRSDLTPQETEIASLASTGHTNIEIGAKLFLSPRTVEWHLRKIYPKLGVASRRELRSALPRARAAAVAA